MPFVVTPDRNDPWLDRGAADAAQMMKLLQPIPDEALTFHRVSTRAN